MLVRATLALTLALTLSLPASAAPPAPRDAALRVAPADFALVVVVQNLRDNINTISESPFASWFPTSGLGKQFLGGADFRKITDSATPVFGALGITPSDVFQDIAGDAVVFAYSPATAGDPKNERSVILLHPRKVDTLIRVIDRLNDGQTKSKELKAVVTHQYAGVTYSERQKADGSSDFYCFRDGVFAFSSSEAEIKAVIDRDASAAKDKPPELVARMTKLGVADAAVAVLVNPRPLDAELAAKVKNAKPDDKAFLAKFAEVWAATDAAAIYLAVGADAEFGVSLQFNPAKVPAGAKGWLVGDRTPSALWAAVPDDAFFAVAGRVKATDILDFLGSISPADDKKGVRETIEQTLGPIVGKDKLPLVLDAIGPHWAFWVAPPAKSTKDAVPALVAAVKVQTDGPKGAEASKALLQALDFGFQTGRFAYNASHKDQLELRDEKDGDVVIKSLSGDAFPAGMRPCFALKGGYLVMSTSPEAIKAFKAPTGDLKPGGEVPLVRFNAASARDYLTSHGPALAKVLSTAGAGDAKELGQQLDALALVLEPVEKVELIARGDPSGLKVMLRVKLVKPLKK